MNKIAKFYGGLSKFQKNADNFLEVEGIASSNAIDSDGEVITSQAMINALPAYMKYANIREMHGSIAAGKAIAAHVQDDGKTFLKALVVDAQAILKVMNGVYNGFSIGGRVIKRNPENSKEITEIELFEISLVDRPANPDSNFFSGDKFLMFKADGIQEVDNLDNSSNINSMNAKNENTANKSETKSETTEETKSETTEETKSETTEETKSETTEEEAEKAIKIDEATKFLKGLGFEVSSQDEITKAIKINTEELSKSQDLNKSLQESLSKVQSDNDNLTKRNKELEDLPKAPKAVFGVVEKNNDGASVSSKEDEVSIVETEGKVNLGASLMKTMLLKNGFGIK